jgi:hypothetical protein
MEMKSSKIKSRINISEGKRELMSDDVIGGAGVEGKLNRVGIDRMRVDIGSSCSTLFWACAESLIYISVSDQSTGQVYVLD